MKTRNTQKKLGIIAWNISSILIGIWTTIGIVVSFTVFSDTFYGFLILGSLIGALTTALLLKR